MEAPHRPTRQELAAADELSREELRGGRRRLEAKVRRYEPEWVAVVGIGAYRVAFERPRAQIGAQTEPIQGSRLWLLPQPSGLNANHQIDDLVRAFGALRRAAMR